MATVVRRNERSWAIDLISKINLIAKNKQIDRYPVHFLLHIIHAAEVIGFNHPDPNEAEFWKAFYYNMVQAFHMYPETKEQNNFRLRDGVDTCCHKT